MKSARNPSSREFFKRLKAEPDPEKRTAMLQEEIFTPDELAEFRLAGSDEERKKIRGRVSERINLKLENTLANAVNRCRSGPIQ